MFSNCSPFEHFRSLAPPGECCTPLSPGQPDSSSLFAAVPSSEIPRIHSYYHWSGYIHHTSFTEELSAVWNPSMKAKTIVLASTGVFWESDYYFYSTYFDWAHRHTGFVRSPELHCLGLILFRDVSKEIVSNGDERIGERQVLQRSPNDQICHLHSHRLEKWTWIKHVFFPEKNLLCLCFPVESRKYRHGTF